VTKGGIMKRRNYTTLQDTIAWFDLSKSETWEEDTYWNGNNHISKATGTQWDHEQLYKSRKGSWIINRWSQWQGSTERWTQIGESEAHEWLLRNGEADAVPVTVLTAMEG